MANQADLTRVYAYRGRLVCEECGRVLRFAWHTGRKQEALEEALEDSGWREVQHFYDPEPIWVCSECTETEHGIGI